MSRKLFELTKEFWIDSCIKNAFNLTITRKAGKTSYLVPIIRGMGIANLVLSERWMLDVLALISSQGGTFVDVGANVGQTLIKVKSVDPDWKYWF